MIDQEEFHEALSQGEMDKAKRLTREALERGESAEAILKEGLVRAMERIGVRFKEGEIFIPEVLIAARAMHGGLAVLKPILSRSTGVLGGKVVLGTVKGDLHDIGKNLVGMMMEGGGYEVIDLGIDVPASKFVEAIGSHGPQVVGLSALLTNDTIDIAHVKGV